MMDLQMNVTRTWNKENNHIQEKVKKKSKVLALLSL